MNITRVPLFYLFFKIFSHVKKCPVKKKNKFSFLLLIQPTSAASVKIREPTYKA